MEHLSVKIEWGTLKENCWDTSAWEAAGFSLSRRLRLLFTTWITFTRFPSSCINPRRLAYLSHLSLKLDAINEQELTILGMLPELRFLDLTLKSTAEMKCNTAAAPTDAAKGGEVLLFQKLRRFNLNYSEKVWLLLGKDNESSGASFPIGCVHAVVLLGSEWEGVCSGGGLVPTLMPCVQKLSFTQPLLGRLGLASEYRSGYRLHGCQ
nr:unnamed protein product [Digitaria exilis]